MAARSTCLEGSYKYCTAQHPSRVSPGVPACLAYSGSSVWWRIVTGKVQVGYSLLTGRLSLRRPTREDIGVILAIHSDPRACRYNPSDALATRDGAERCFERWDDHWRRFGFGYWVVRCRGCDPPVGFCGIKMMRLKDERVSNLFYRFDPSSWGRGLASEAATAVVRWAVRHIADSPVIARVHPQNIASQRVASHAGLIRAEHLDGPGFDGWDWIYTSRPGFR